MEGKSNQENLGGHLQPTQSPIFEQINAIGSNTDRILPLDVRHLGDIRRNTSTLIVHHLLRWEEFTYSWHKLPLELIHNHKVHTVFFTLLIVCKI